MSDIAPIGRPLPAGFDAGPSPSRVNGQARAIDRENDSVELSSHAQLLGKLRDLPVREGLVGAVKAEIDAGIYETDDRINAAVDAILDDLG